MNVSLERRVEGVPRRIQRQRTKGWRMPANAVYVGRPSKWGNPYEFSRRAGPGTRRGAVEGYRRYLSRHAWLSGHLFELRRRDLVCWCPLDQPCHADVLLELANR